MVNTQHPGGLFSIGLSGNSGLTDQDKMLLEFINPSGVILFQRNISEPEQIVRLINDITQFLGYKPLISIDQEGGIVSRLTKGFTVSPGAMAISRTGEPHNSRLVGKILGKEMKAVGIDWDLAPVVDINNNPENPGIGIRSYGDTREIVTLHAKAFVCGLREEGIISCLKHFPGKGRVETDAHLDMPELNIDEKILFQDELYPYMNIDAPAWMPSHVYYPAFQSIREPASVSKEVLTGLARERLRFKGILVSDDMTMGGIVKYYSVAEGVRKSFLAGMDNLLICHDFHKQIASFKIIEEEVERNETSYHRMVESIKRILGLFEIRNIETPCPKSLRSKEHMETMATICRESVAIVKNADNAIPVDTIDLIYSVEFSRKIEIEDFKDPVPTGVTDLSRKTGAPIQFITAESLKDIAVLADTGKDKKVVIFTENAHLDNAMKELIRQLSDKAEVMTVCALRNPYDQDIEGVRNIICSCGYTINQQKRVIELLLGNDE